MSIKKHPILLVSVILVITCIILGAVMFALSGILKSSSSGIGFSNKIGVVEITNEITDSSTIIDQLTEFKKDKRIKAIIIRINSPGGSVGASQEIYSEVRKITKPKIVSMGDTAASGGYYIACAADRIVANPGTITGSIGVIMSFYRIDELAKKIGFTMESIKSGEFKDTGSPFREMTEREKELMNEVVLNIKEQFVRAVAQGRRLQVEKVREIADGRIFTGEMAVGLGLVDQVGNLQDAVDLAAKAAGIEGEPTLVYPETTKVRLWDVIFQSASSAFFKTVSENIKPVVEYRWNGLAN